jgi:hypothetical protein
LRMRPPGLLKASRVSGSGRLWGTSTSSLTGGRPHRSLLSHCRHRVAEGAEHILNGRRVGRAIGRGAHAWDRGDERGIAVDGPVGEPGMEVPDRDPEASERGEALDAHAVGGGRLRAERGAAEEREREASLGGEEPVAWVTMGHGSKLPPVLRRARWLPT